MKTPTALTPCRRMGLSRSASKNISSSFFLSPLLSEGQVKLDVTPKSTVPPQIKSTTTEVASNEGASIMTRYAASDEFSTPNMLAPRQTVSTGCGRYRLSLNKRIRDKLSKKKIDFVALTGEAPLQVDERVKCNDSPKPSATLSEQIVVIKADIAAKKCKIAAIEIHNAEIAELEAAIRLWKAGFQQAVHAFQSQLTPAQEFRTILQHLNIPLNILDI